MYFILLFQRLCNKIILASPTGDRTLDNNVSFNIPTATDIDGGSVYSATAREIFFLFYFPFIFVLTSSKSMNVF